MDWQKTLFDWAAVQPGLTGAVIFGTGLLYGLCGFRLVRSLLVMPCAALGCLLGALLATLANLPPLPLVPVVGVLGGILAIVRPQVGIILSSGATWAALGGYLALQFGLSEVPALITLAICGVGGAVLTLLSRPVMIILFTTWQGAGLMVIGFVSMSSAVFPSLGVTFRSLAHSQALAVPILLAMVATMAYSYQASARQGNIFTGMQSPPTT
ncbi:MAG: hypothetical protein KAY37_14645 [Phycisphaerae bacterium]|nr:hypothetical protein [Phycisphaerae bacterium]